MPAGHKSNDPTRDPCPYNIISDIGWGFALGGVLGGGFNAWKGYKNSPRGERFAGVLTAVKTRAPVLAGNFAVWSGLFNAFDCTFHSLREKEDAWNSVLAGAATGGLLSVRAGPVAVLVSATFGGIFLGVIEGVGVVWSRVQGQGSIDPQPYPESQPQPKPTGESPVKSTFGFH